MNCIEWILRVPSEKSALARLPPHNKLKQPFKQMNDSHTPRTILVTGATAGILEPENLL